MNTDEFRVVDFPFSESAREELSEKYSISDVFTEDIIEESAARIVRTAEENPPKLSKEARFKTFIGAKALLSYLSTPLYTLVFFREEANRLLDKYALSTVSEAVSFTVEKVSTVDSSVLRQSVFADTFEQESAPNLKAFGDKYFPFDAEGRPIYSFPELEYYVDTGDFDGIVSSLYYNHKQSAKLFRIPVKQVLNSGIQMNIQSLRIVDGDAYLTESELANLLRLQVMFEMSEKYPTPIPDEFSDLLKDKSEHIESQISAPTIELPSEEVIVDWLPQRLRIVYSRGLSNSDCVSKEEYELLFSVLSHIGVDLNTVAEQFTFQTEVAENYFSDLVRDSSLSRRESPPTWEDVQQVCQRFYSPDVVYRVTETPVEYYQISGTMPEVRKL